jgi:hypothetical protein
MVEEDGAMRDLNDGRVWHGDHLVDPATPGDILRLLEVVDGTDSGHGLVHRVREFAAEVDGAVVIHGFGISDPRKAPETAPLGQLEDAPTFEAPRSRPATVTVVSREAPDGLDDIERRLRELPLGSGVMLVTVAWGDVATWVSASPLRGAPATTVESAFMLALAPAERVVPSLREARRSLAGDAGDPGVPGGAPGGQRGQTLRERGFTWPSVPDVATWDDDAADPWVLSGLLERVTDRRSPGHATPLGVPVPRITTLVPGGAPVLVASAGGGLIPQVSDRLLSLWEGKDESGRTVAIAVHRSAAEVPPLALPIWSDQRASDPSDRWSGEVTEHEYEWGEVARYRLRVTPFGRLTFPSRRIVASDQCVAGRSPAMGLTLQSAGPFPVLRADLMTVLDEGGELDGQSRGILLVLDADRAPSRWEPATDVDGRPIDCSIETGRLFLGDAEGANALQRQVDEGTAAYQPQARLVLHRSDPRLPADLAVLADLAGDGPAWVVVGMAEEDRPVAVLVANFDPLA